MIAPLQIVPPVRQQAPAVTHRGLGIEPGNLSEILSIPRDQLAGTRNKDRRLVLDMITRTKFLW